MLFSDFNSKSLQADRLFRKRSAAMVQETKEPGQTEFAQKVSRGQVNTPTHTRTLFNIYAHTSIELWSRLKQLLTPAFLRLYEHISEGRSSPLFLTCTHYNATLLLPAMPVAPTLLTHKSNHPHSLVQGLCNRGPVTVVGYFYVSELTELNQQHDHLIIRSY